MGEHDAFGIAGCAGGEHDLDKVVGCNVHFFGWRHAGDGFFKLFEGYFGDCEVYVSLRGEAGGEGQFRVGARDYSLHVVGGASEVERDDDEACPDTAEEDEHPVG